MKKEELLEILSQGVDYWNNWRQSNPSIEINLDDTSLENFKVLDGIDFSNASLINTEFYSNSLIGSNFTNANLELVIMRDVDCSVVNFFGANLNLANIQNAKLIGADFTFVNSDMATIKKCDLTGAILSDWIEATLIQYKGENIM